MKQSWIEKILSQSFYLLFVFGASLLLIQAVKQYQKRKNLLRDLSLFPGPFAHWLHGHKKFFPEKELELYSEMVEKYHHAVPIWIGPFMMFFHIFDPEYVKIVLNRKDSKHTFTMKMIEPWLGRGLISLDGDKWLKHRQLFKPGFHTSILKIYITFMTESVRVMLDKWEKLIAKDPLLDITESISMMALDSIMKSAFNEQGSVQTDRVLDSYLKATLCISQLISERIYNILHQNDLFYKFTSENHHFHKSCQVTHQYTEKIIQEREKSFNSNTNQNRHRDFLDIVMSARAEDQKGFSQEDLYAEVKTFMFAGHDTTSSAISWIFYCLAKYPEYQQKCREEIREILGDSDSITWEHLNQMTYSTMCIKECLRLYSPAILATRWLTSPLTFPDGRSLPAGVTVAINFWALHRNPDHWENPQVFNPLRFSKENSEKRHSYAFLPFSSGPRNCIGQQYAMLECKVALALTLLRFELILDPSRPPKPIRKIVLKSQNGIHLFLKKLG